MVRRVVSVILIFLLFLITHEALLLGSILELLLLL
eukprot:UN05184